MPIGHFSYLDLTPAQRRRAANHLRQKVRQSMGFMSPGQVAHVQEQLRQLGEWENGTVGVAKPGTHPRTPVKHDVALTESVTIKERAG